MLVRSFFGSIERFVALLLEHFSGKLPFWLLPEQARILTLGNNQEYAEKIRQILGKEGFRIGLDLRQETLGKRICNAEESGVPYQLVIGEKEETNNKITLRSCSDHAAQHMTTIEELLGKFHEEASLRDAKQGDKKAL